MNYKEKIKARQRELRLSNEQVAKRIGVSVSAYGHYKNGTRKPDMEKMKLIALALGTSVEDLFY